MNAIVELDIALSRRPSVVLMPFLSELIDADASIAERVGRAGSELDRAESEMNAAMDAIGAAVDQARSLMASGETTDWDRLVEKAMRAEQEWSKEVATIVRTIRRLDRLLKSASPEAWRKLRPTLERCETALRRADETFRRARWDLMILQGETEDDTGAPVFDDPRELRRHLVGRTPTR